MSNAPSTVTGLDRFFHYLSAEDQLAYLKELLRMLGDLPQTTEHQDRAAMLCLDVDGLFPRTREGEAEHEQLMDKLAFPQGYGRLKKDELNRLADLSSVTQGMRDEPLAFVLKRRLAVALDAESIELDPRVTGHFR